MMLRLALCATVLAGPARSDPFDWHRLQISRLARGPAVPESLRLMGNLTLHRSHERNAVMALPDGTVFCVIHGQELAVVPGRLLRASASQAVLRLDGEDGARTLRLRRDDGDNPP
ncbi:hypothetical protein [Paludibacterium yongneupense]|uniref:hypothetical protein n=1 Tax=Paludibacterium yongneupense TaxID=400061 RepID=UPI0003F7EC16|nr:hypothetical protein [Paludibacterium yongneupense]